MGKIPLLSLPDTTGVAAANRAGPPVAIDYDDAMIGEIHGNVCRLLWPYRKEK